MGNATTTADGHTNGLRLVLLLTMASWGANLSVMKWLMLTLDPLATAVLRMATSSLLLLAWLAWRHWGRGLRVPRLSRRQWVQLGLCAAVMMYANQALLTLGVQRTVAANASLIVALNPLVGAVLATLLLGERLSGRRLAGVAVGFAGVATVVLHRPGMALGQGSLGDLIVFVAVVTWMLGGVMVQRLARELDTAVISTGVTVLGTLMLAVHVALDPGTGLPPLASISAMHWWLIGLSGLFASAIGGLVWNHALRSIGVARASLYAYWVPIFGVAFAVLALGESLTVWHLVGLAAVLGGTWIGTRR